MKTLLKFKSTKFHKFNNAEHTNTIARFVEITKTAGIETVHYEQGDMDRLEEIHGQEQDLVARNMAAEETATMNELEAKRDEKGLYIIDTVRNSRNLPFPEIAQAAQALWYVVSPYEGFHTLPNMQETATIEGMILDLTKDANAGYVQTLALTPTLEELIITNTEYKNLTEQRTKSREEAKTADSKTLRTEMDAIVQYITDVAFAHNTVTPSDKLSSYINSINAIIDEANTAYNQRTAQQKKKDEKKEENVENEEEES